jgi:uncharacterized delta-60 repeat protein
MKKNVTSESAFFHAQSVLRVGVVLTAFLVTLLAWASPETLVRHRDPKPCTSHHSSFDSPSGLPEAWVARYSGPEYQDEARAMAVDSSGNVYVTGSSWGSGTFTDYATVKYNSAGQQQWVARHDGPANFYDSATAITVDASDNVYVTGETVNSNFEDDYTTIKYNASGQEQWVATYDGHGSFGDYAIAIAVDASGNVYVTGTSDDGDGISDYATVKYNSAGQEQWVARYSGSANGGGSAAAMTIDNAGNLYVTGTAVNGNSGADYATVKYNSAGQQQWVAFYSGPGTPGNSDSAEAIVLDPSGNVYVTGESQGVGTDLDYATVKYNSAGQQQWAARYVGPSDHDEAHGIGVDSTGNVYVTGFSYNSGSNYDYATVKYNSAGQQQWVDRYDGPANSTDFANAVAVDNSGDVYVTGTSIGDVGYYDYATVKYNSSGQRQWVARYDGPGHDSDEATTIVTDGLGNVYVTGYSSGSGFDFDYATIKYAQGPTPTPTSTPTATATATQTPTLTPSVTPTPTAFGTTTPSVTPTATAIVTATPTGTATATPTPTSTVTATPSTTPRATPTPRSGLSPRGRPTPPPHLTPPPPPSTTTPTPAPRPTPPPHITPYPPPPSPRPTPYPRPSP